MPKQPLENDLFNKPCLNPFDRKFFDFVVSIDNANFCIKRSKYAVLIELRVGLTINVL